MSDQVLEAVQKLAGSIETKSATTAKEIEAVKTDFEQKAAEAKQEVKDLTEKVLKMGGAIEDAIAEVKELKIKKNTFGGDGNMAPSVFGEVKQAIADNKDKFAAMEKGGRFEPVELKTVANISSANLSGTGSNYISYLGWQDGMEPLGQERFRSLVRTIQSDTDFVRYPRANSPIGEGSFTRQSSEGATKSQIDRDYTMIDLTLKPMSGYAIVSRQALRNISFLQSWMPTSMLEQLQENEDIDFTNTLYAAATGSKTKVGSTTISYLVNYIKSLKQSKYTPNAIAVAGSVWTDLILTTAATSGEYTLPNVVTVDVMGMVRILGLPVIMWNQLVGNQVIVGDFRKCAIVQSEGLVMRQSDSHASTFTSNEVTFLLERTEGLAIFRPDAFISNYL